MATLDLLSASEAKAAANIDVSTQDTEVAALITAVSLQLDNLCGPIVKRTVTSESHDGDRRVVFLRYRPVASVSAVVEYAGATATTLTAETAGSAGTYLVEPVPGEVRRRASFSDQCFASGRRNVLVTYSAGRYDSTGVVGEQFKQAAKLAFTNLWRREQGVGTETFGAVATQLVPGFALPNAVLDLLADEIQAPELS